MIKSKTDFIVKVHLIISLLIVVPIAFVYGFQPNSQFDIYLNTTDEYSQFKAIMGLYLAFSALWILGIFKPDFHKIAIVANMVFMLGLGFGRLLSILLDGIPGIGYVFGTSAELFLGGYGAWVLKNYDLNKIT